MAGIDKKGPFRAFLRRAEMYDNYRRYGVLPNSINTGTPFYFYLYIALNTPQASVQCRDDFDFPIILLDEKDSITFHWGDIAFLTALGITITGAGIRLISDVVVKNHVQVPFIEQFDFELKEDAVFRMVNGPSLYPRIDILNPSHKTTDGNFNDNVNEYATISAKTDGRYFIEENQPGDWVNHLEWLESERKVEDMVFTAADALALGAIEGVFNPNLNSSRTIERENDWACQNVYNIGFGGKLSYCLFSEDNVTMRLPNPTIIVANSYHFVQYERLVPNKELPELGKRIRKINGNIPATTGQQGVDALENIDRFAPYVVL